MQTSGGTLTLDGRHISITQADCTLFVGRLAIDFESQDGDGACRSIPFGDVVKFPELSGRAVVVLGKRELIKRVESTKLPLSP